MVTERGIEKLDTNTTLVYDNLHGSDMVEIYSYTSCIMIVDAKTKEVLRVGSDWDYSTTTAKGLNKALRFLGMNNIADLTKAQKTKYFIERGLITG